MRIAPGSASRDDLTALQDVLECARFPGTAPTVTAASFDRVAALIVEVERSIRTDVLVRHMEPAEHAAQFVPGELDPGDGG